MIRAGGLAASANSVEINWLQKAKIIFDVRYNPGPNNELVVVPWPEVMATVKSLRVPLQTRKAAADYLAVYEALDPDAPCRSSLTV
ncbi:hypothetical protein Pelo_7630 [Pelomyxa schiedti]|nr:hypothetical protein Pelo_7630 [Pelomyxa schiedti]